jgi:hypothetical protein
MPSPGPVRESMHPERAHYAVINDCYQGVSAVVGLAKLLLPLCTGRIGQLERPREHFRTTEYFVERRKVIRLSPSYP